MVWAVLGEPSAIAHLLAIAMVGRDQTCAAERQNLWPRSADDTLIDRFHRFDSGRDHAGMADHVGIGKIQNDQVVFRACARALRPSLRGALISGL